MLFLNKKDINLIDRSLIQDAVARSYDLMNRNLYNMPDRIHVQDQDNTLLLMPCFTREYFATKLVSVFPGAQAAGFPVVNGLMALADNKTGQPLAVMDGAAVTAERTGAVGGLAVSLLTDTDLKRAGICGAGVQGLSQARYLLMNRNLEVLMISDLNPNAAAAMAQTLSKDYPKVEFVVAETTDDLVRSSSLIIAATTTKTPLFSDDAELVKGKTFISIGSFRPDMKEFPDAVISTADRIYVDTPFAAKESGDICIPLERGIVAEENIHPFAGLIGGARLPSSEINESGTCLFKSVGMALFDLTVASVLYERAKEAKTGVELDF